MKLSRLLAQVLATAACLVPGFAQTSPHRGLWVGEVFLDAVNQTTVPLDENNIPRAADPDVPTPTSDVANLRLILHVDAVGRVSLLKHVAILARKADEQTSESDLALVTDPALYGAFPPQPAKRISAVAFDYGDARATHILNGVVEAVATEAARVANLGNRSRRLEEIENAARGRGQAVVQTADAANAYSAFLQNHLNATIVRTIANGGSDASARSAATDLRDSSIFRDTRGLEMLDAIAAALADLPADATPALREQTALNVAASYAETDRAYDRFLAGESFGDFIEAASQAAASAATGLPLRSIEGFQASPSGPLTTVISNAHGLSNNTEIVIQGAGLVAWNGLHRITPAGPDAFQIPVPFNPGGAIESFSAHQNIGPLVITSPSHGLANGNFVILRETPAPYAGRHLVTVIDSDRFSIDVPFFADPPDRGTWAVRAGSITGYEGTPDGGVGTLVTAPRHGLNNGDRVRIVGAGAPSYNGVRTVTRISDNAFSLDQAFAGNPEQKGIWELAVEIEQFSPPAGVPTLVRDPGHGLQSGDRITISGSDLAAYNDSFVVERVDADHFAIPLPFDEDDGNPSTKGSWLPAAGGRFRVATLVRGALDASPEVAAIRTEALNVKLTPFSDTRPQDAVEMLLDTIIRSAAGSASLVAGTLPDEIRTAALATLANEVPRFSSPSTLPSSAYDEFVRSSAFINAPAVAAQAAAQAAVAERSQLLATESSIRDKALQAAINALQTTFSTAARALLTELPMEGTFGPGGPGLDGEIFLPANHPTNPFRHRRHPDHTVGIDVRRVIGLTFDAADAQPLRRPNFGVDRLTGTYEEEVFGLHKPLGPDRDIGLKVRGTFELNRVSLIDTLNGR